MELDYDKLGKRVKEIREEKGLSQETVAERAGMSANHLSHIECANTKASLEKFVNLANALDTTLDAFFCDSLKAAKAPYMNKIIKLAEDCDGTEIRLFCSVLESLKSSYREIK